MEHKRKLDWQWLRQRVPTREQLQTRRWLRWLSPWLGHPRLWLWSRRGVAMGVALGVFFGLLIPLAQIPLSAAAAVVLRANLPVAAASTLVTNPVTFAPVYYAAYRLGSWITGEDEPPAALPAPAATADDGTGPSLWARIGALGKPLLIGLSILSAAAGLTSYLIIHLLWRLHIVRRWRRRRTPTRT